MPVPYLLTEPLAVPYLQQGDDYEDLAQYCNDLTKLLREANQHRAALRELSDSLVEDETK